MCWPGFAPRHAPCGAAMHAVQMPQSSSCQHLQSACEHRRPLQCELSSCRRLWPALAPRREWRPSEAGGWGLWERHAARRLVARWGRREGPRGGEKTGEWTASYNYTIVIAGIEGTRKSILFDIFINTAFYWEQYSVTFDTVQGKTLAYSLNHLKINMLSVIISRIPTGG